MKKPEIKVPTFLSDLFGDLRDKRLLPLVGVLAIAILAVPFALSQPTSPSTAPAPTAGPGADNRLTIAPANPGLRDYKLRLRGDHPKDPFDQQYTGAPKSTSSKA